MRKIQLSFLFIILHIGACIAQSDTLFTKIFTQAQLQEDLTYWRDRLEKKLPILYLYKSKEAVDKKFDSIYNAIDHPMNELEFYRMLTPLTTFIQDGHNSIIPGEHAMEALRGCNDLFPLDIKCIKNKLYVSYNYSSASELSPGTEIISINNISADVILNKFLSNLPQEGNNQQYIFGSINSAFRFYYFVYYGLAEKYNIAYKNLNGKVGNCEVTGIALLSMKNQKEKANIPDLNPYNLKVLDSMHTAVLTIKTFDQTLIKNTYNKKFKRDVSGYFNLIQDANVTNLVIDLRGNMGGNPDYVKYLLSYLFDEPFEQATECRVVKNKDSENFMERNKKSWFPFYGIGKFQPKKNNFKESVYVLINESTFSAGVILASTLKRENRATFIGTETGGNPVIMSGFFMRSTWQLPNTRIQITPATLATIYNPIELNTGRGLIPDHIIELTPEQLALSEDVYLNYTLDLIKKPQ